MCLIPALGNQRQTDLSVRLQPAWFTWQVSIQLGFQGGPVSKRPERGEEKRGEGEEEERGEGRE